VIQKPSLWHIAYGEDLLDTTRSGDSLDSVLPDCAAIYMWKRRLRPPRTALVNATHLLEWCLDLTRTPIGEIRDVSLSHFLHINSLELSGLGLPESKHGDLKQFLQTPKNRLWLAKALDELSIHTPALYVGESGCLPERIAQHIGGQSPFGAKVEESSLLDWASLNLYYCDLGSGTGSKKQRTALEYMITQLTVAGMTARPG